MYAETSRPWMMAAYACWRQGLTVGTIYATLGEDGALFGINQSECKVAIWVGEAGICREDDPRTKMFLC